MTQRPDYDRGKRDGIRWAVTWLHKEARTMNDPHATTVLNNAGFHMGSEAARDNWLARSELASASAGGGETTPAVCLDCGLAYDDPGFCDLVVSDEAWRAISPTDHGGGLLCPTCMCRAAARVGLEGVTAIFRSGPFAPAHAAPEAGGEKPQNQYYHEGEWHDEGSGPYDYIRYDAPPCGPATWRRKPAPAISEGREPVGPDALLKGE